MAALFLRQVSRCRSRQLYDALILPPTNHLVLGIVPSRTLSHLRNQWRLAAISPQKPAGSSFARFQSLLYSSSLLMLASAANSAGGGKTRNSCRTLSMLSPVAAVLAAPVLPALVMPVMVCLLLRGSFQPPWSRKGRPQSLLPGNRLRRGSSEFCRRFRRPRLGE